jgi:4-hydroxy-2-oxoheptanedioate aldolase
VRRRSFAELMPGGRRVLGTWSQLADPDVVDLLGGAGFDFSIIDCEHGAFGIEAAARLIRACEAAGLVALVRVPRGEHALACKVLDSGAAGIVAPGVESAAEARGWVQALRFAPEGGRGACPIVRAAGHSLASWSETVDQQSGNGLVVLVETAAGVRAARDIAATPGVHGLMVGPFDLSCSLGLPGQLQAAPVQQGVQQVVEAALRQGVAPWLPVFAGDAAELGRQADAWTAQGVNHFAVGADKIMLAAALRSYRAAAAG